LLGVDEIQANSQSSQYSQAVDKSSQHAEGL